MHSQHQDTRAKIASGDWSDETQKAVRDAVEAFAQDFGYDLDEEGLAIDDEAPLKASEPHAQDESREEEPAAA
jgi:F-type H+-transporting ATPase subunit alpha